MAIDSKTLAAARKYTDQSVAGGGAIKGKNCVVDSIISITGGHRVTFKWTLDDGTVLTNYMDVMDGVDGANGADGADGRGIDSVDVDANNHLIVTYDDGTNYDAGEIQVTGQTIQRNVLPTASASELGNIYQYIGATDANYTNGYFYQCVADGAGYKWENKKVQAGGGSGVDNFKDLDDVSFSSLTDGDLPQYNQTSGKWENSNQIPLGIQHLQGSMANLQIAIHNLDLLVASKVDKVPGKDLSTNDFTDNDKQKLDKLQPIYLIGSGLNLDGSVLKATGMSIPIDTQLDPTSANPVQNKAIAVPVQALQGSMSQVQLDITQLQGSVLGKADKSDITRIDLDINQLQGSLANKEDKSNLGTAAYKDSTNAVTSGSHDLVESGAVQTAIDSALTSVYRPAGSKSVAQLTSALLIQGNLGRVYNMSDDGLTTADFVEGAGHPIHHGDNVAVVDVGTLLSPVYKFDLLAGWHDEFTPEETVDVDGKVVFDNLSDDYVYGPPAGENRMPTVKSFKKEAGTLSGIKLTYETDLPQNTKVKLHIMKG